MGQGRRAPAAWVFPALAGMNRGAARAATGGDRVPRARGDEPLASQAIDDTRSAVSLPIPFVMRFAVLVAAAERAEREKQKPVTTVENRYNADGKSCHITDDLPAGMKLYAAPPVTEQGCVTVTTDESGRAVAVTRQDDEHRILSVIWEAPVTAPVRLTDRDKDDLAAPYSGMGGIEDYRAYAQDIETAALRANGFDIQPARGADGE